MPKFRGGYYRPMYVHRVEAGLDAQGKISAWNHAIVGSSILAGPVLWWRSVGHSHTAFVMETMMDELAAAAGKDPVVFRREMLAKHPRVQRVLDLAASKAGWGSAPPQCRGRGIAVHESFGSVCAQVA